MEVGKRDIEQIEKYVTVNRQAPHTNHPTAAPTTAPKNLRTPIEPIILKLPSIPSLPELPSEELPVHHLDCPHGELLTFWQRTTAADSQYVTPYANSGPAVKYVTFEPGTPSCLRMRQQLYSFFLLLFLFVHSIILLHHTPCRVQTWAAGTTSECKWSSYWCSPTPQDEPSSSLPTSPCTS